MSVGWLFFSFKGRVNRARYLGARLALSLAFAGLLWAIVVLSEGIDDRVMAFGAVVGLFIVLDLAVTLSGFALDVKRLHDHDLSAWWILVGLVPVVGLLLPPIAFYLLPGDRGANRYGADPVTAKAPSVEPNRALLRALFEVGEPTWR